MDDTSPTNDEEKECERFDFDGWLELARTDPQALEAKRQGAIDELMAQAPAELRPRLEGLQWRIDMIRARSDTPLGACVEISELMWDQILGPNGLVTSLCTLSEDEDSPPAQTAQILDFPVRSDQPYS